jgi:hypothetical protein
MKDPWRIIQATVPKSTYLFWVAWIQEIQRGHVSYVISGLRVNHWTESTELQDVKAAQRHVEFKSLADNTRG